MKRKKKPNQDRLSKKQLHKIALYLKYIAFLLERDSAT